MAVMGYIRRIDLEPKEAYLGPRTYAHVFLINGAGDQVDVYTEDPRFEAALLAVFEPSDPEPPKVEVHYEEVGSARKVTRVIVDRDFLK